MLALLASSLLALEPVAASDGSPASAIASPAQHSALVLPQPGQLEALDDARLSDDEQDRESDGPPLWLTRDAALRGPVGRITHLARLVPLSAFPAQLRYRARAPPRA